MMQTLVGRDGFARGMTLYFERHDGQAVTCDDFAQAIADANPGQRRWRALLPQFKRWYSQAGTPRVTARGRYDAPTRTYTLGLEQAPHVGVATAHEPFVIPLDDGPASARDGRALPLRLEDEPERRGRDTRVLVLDEAQRVLHLRRRRRRAAVPSLLRGFSAPVILVDGLGDADLLVLLRHDSDPFNRWEAGQRLALQRLLAALRAGAAADALDAAFVDAMRERAAPSAARCRVQGAGADAAERGLRRRAARRRSTRSASTRCARRCGSALASALRDDWDWAFDAHQVARRLHARPGARPAGARWPTWPGDAVPATRSRAATRSGRAAPTSASRTRRNMTDRLGALSALLCSQAELADAGAASASTRCSTNEPLVVDKWFALQASAPRARAAACFARVRQLLQPSATSRSRNPNRARSLICALLPAATRRLPPRRRGGLRVLGRPRDRARRHQSAARVARWRARSTAGASWPSPTAARRARRSRAWHAQRPERRRARDRHQGAAGSAGGLADPSALRRQVQP